MNLRNGMEMVGTGVPGDKFRVSTPQQASMARRKKAVDNAALEAKELKLGLRQKSFIPTLNVGRKRPGFTLSGRG